jgi:hypothetical protein
MSSNTRTLAILKLPKPNKSFLTFAKAVHDHLAGNPSFPSPSPALALFAADIHALDEAETQAATRAKGTTQARNARKLKVKEDLMHLRDYVQSVVEKQPSSRDAAALIESAFMSVRKTIHPSKAELSARNTGVSGTVRLNAKAVAHSAIYYWQYSLDQQTWTSVTETMQARTMIADLTLPATYYFRFRAFTRADHLGFSQVVRLLVL